MKRYHSTLGPFMLTRLAVIVPGTQFMQRAELLDMPKAEPLDTVSHRAKRFVDKMRERVAKDARRFQLGDMWHGVEGLGWLDGNEYAEWSLDPQRFVISRINTDDFAGRMGVAMSSGGANNDRMVWVDGTGAYPFYGPWREDKIEYGTVVGVTADTITVSG